MGDREEMLTRVANALGRATASAAPAPLRTFSRRPLDLRGESLVELFVSELTKVGGRVERVGSAPEVCEYLCGLSPEAGTVAVTDAVAEREPQLGRLLEERGVRVNAVPRAGGGVGARASGDDRRNLLDASVGVTFADYAVAETGTLALVSGGERHRLASLLPPVHVCLLDPALILPDLSALLRRAGERLDSNGAWPHSLTLVTGPSRTADIEHTVTTGVHGPRELHVLLWRRAA